MMKRQPKLLLLLLALLITLPLSVAQVWAAAAPASVETHVSPATTIDPNPQEESNPLAAPDALPGWPYRKEIPIEGSGGVITDYQMKLVVAKEMPSAARVYYATEIVEKFAKSLENRYFAWAEGAIYGIGGNNDDVGPVDEEDDVEKWIPGGGDAVKVADLDTAITFAGIAYADVTGKIYIYGGSGVAGAIDDIQWFKPDDDSVGTCTESLPATGAMEAVAYSTVQEKVYTFGGWLDGAVTDKIFRHDPDGETFTDLDPIVMPWTAQVMVAVYVPTQDSNYIFGGANFGTPEYFDNIARFYCGNETIVELGETCPFAVKGHKGYYDEDAGLIVMGGGRDSGADEISSYHNDIWTFNPVGYAVTTLGEKLPRGLDDHGAAYDTTNNIGYFCGTLLVDTLTVSGGGQKYITKVDNVISLGGNCVDAFDNITFTQADGTTELDHWREGYGSGDYAIFWVEVDSIASDGTSIYIYYGKDGASSESDGDTTFIVFADVEEGDTSDFDDTQGTIAATVDHPHTGTYGLKMTGGGAVPYAGEDVSGTNQYYELWIYDDDITTANFKIAALMWDGANVIQEGIYITQSATHYAYNEIGGTWETSNIARTNGWHKLGMLVGTAKTTLLIDDTVIHIDPGLDEGNLDTFYFYGEAAGVGYGDDMLVRKFVPHPAPFWGTFGAEEEEEEAGIRRNLPCSTVLLF